MGKNSIVFCLERKDKDQGRTVGVACYIRNDALCKRLNDHEVDKLEVIWIKIMPAKITLKMFMYIVCMYILHS